MNMMKIAMLVMAASILAFMGTASAVHQDWLSPHGAGGMQSWHHPAYSWHSPVTYYWNTYYYNYFDPWWTANVYRPVRTTYYWHRWGW